MTTPALNPRNTQWVDSIWADEAQKGVFRSCVACGQDATYTGTGPHAEREYDNALFLAITGGYGQFTDPQDDGGFIPGYKVILCHDCAHEACDKLPWLAALLTPHSSHAHTKPYQDAHPDHYGWDYDMANGTYYPKLAALLFPGGVCTACSHGEASHERKEHMALWVCSEADCTSKGCSPEKRA